MIAIKGSDSVFFKKLNELLQKKYHFILVSYLLYNKN